MGKIPPSFRSAVPSSSSLIKSAHESQPLSDQPRQFIKKLVKRKPTRPSAEQDSARRQHHKPLVNSPDLNEAKTLFNSFVATARAPLELRFNNAFLQSYASISTPDNSVSLLQHMSKTLASFSPDRSTFHVLLPHSSASPDSSLALASVRQMLNLMVNSGFSPNEVTVDIAVRSLCTAGHVDEAIELVKELSSKHCKPDSYTYNFIIKSLCKTRALSTVYGFINEFRTSFDVEPDIVSFTILIDNVCNSKNLREATRLISVLKECGHKPDCFVYNTIMKGYCMLSKGSEAIGIYNQMKEEGVEPDMLTYNTLIFGLSKSGRVNEARKYLNVMVEAGFLPDTVTYTSLMNGLCRERNVMGAMKLLEDMKENNCAPNSCTYNTLLHGLCKGRMLEKGIELYGMMKEVGMQLDTACYATFVRALCREGRVAEAYEVFDYAVESKSLTDVAAYTSLETTLKWLKKAREQGLAV
ncbi:Pentatricopeptide repeat-containing protein At2g17670 [Linum grandiflorum]